MRNKYAGFCYRCGQWCGIGEGHFEKIPYELRQLGDPKYLVQHADCAIHFRGTDLGKEYLVETRKIATDSKLFKQAAKTGKRAQQARQELKRRGMWF